MQPLTPEQDYGADWLAARSRAWLADIPGFGKTRQAIEACRRDGHRRILVACPSIAREGWRREFEKWWPEHPPLQVIQTGRDAVHIVPRDNQPLVLIISLDMPGNDKHLRQRIKACAFDVAILDEAHYLKEPASRRTRCFYGTALDQGPHSLVSRAMNHWLLSASPCPNSAAELYPHLRTFWPELIANEYGVPLGYEQFLERFFTVRKTRFAVSVTGYRDRAGLKRIMDTIMLRRTRLDGVSPITWRDAVTVQGDGSWLDELRDHEDIEDLSALLEAAALRADDADNGADEFIHLATLRRLTALAKANQAADMILMDHYPGYKQIIYGIHREAMDVLEEKLAPSGCVRVDGRSTDRQKQAAIDAFNNDRDVGFFLGQVMACKTAINLPAADRVRFFESSFCPEDNDQAARRGQRRGRQKGSLIVDGIALAGSIDEKVQNVNMRKSALISELMERAN